MGKGGSISVVLSIYIVLLLFLNPNAHADNITLQPDSAAGKDSYIRQDLPNSNFGSTDRLNLGLTGSGDKQRPLLFFNLSSIPQGSTITYAEFKVYLNASQLTSSGLVNLTRITEDWTEGEVTWNNRVTGTTWSNA